MKIIHIMDHPPAYEEYRNQPRPKANWDTPDGSWVGIWGYDWGDQIGSHLISVDKSISFEVWQPDTRADKIYSYTFPNGLIHRNFPAVCKKYFIGLKATDYYSSDEMLSHIKKMEAQQNGVILELPFTQSPFIQKLSRNKRFSVIFTFMGLPDNIIGDKIRCANPVKYLHKHLLRYKQKKFLNSIHNLLIGDYLPVGKKLLEEYVVNKVYTNLVGVDLTAYRPLDKTQAREQLGIALTDFVLFTSSRLIQIKQIDKLIISLKQSQHLDFTFYISGHGKQEYESYLTSIIKDANLNGKVVLLGYISDESLLRYYAACDVFINASKNDGGPISAWKAFAMGVPVINTDIGTAYHFLDEQKTGLIIDNIKHYEWGRILEKVISKQIVVRPADVNIVRKLLNWDNISRERIKIYADVLKNNNQH